MVLVMTKVVILDPDADELDAAPVAPGPVAAVALALVLVVELEPVAAGLEPEAAD
jgi:hypothetical protein